jgi:hypothetical protein
MQGQHEHSNSPALSCGLSSCNTRSHRSSYKRPRATHHGVWAHCCSASCSMPHVRAWLPQPCAGHAATNIIDSTNKYVHYEGVSQDSWRPHKPNNVDCGCTPAECPHQLGLATPRVVLCSDVASVTEKYNKMLLNAAMPRRSSARRLEQRQRTHYGVDWPSLGVIAMLVDASVRRTAVVLWYPNRMAALMYAADYRTGCGCSASSGCYRRCLWTPSNASIRIFANPAVCADTRQIFLGGLQSGHNKCFSFKGKKGTNGTARSATSASRI